MTLDIDTKPYGTYAPNAGQKAILSITRRLPFNWLGKRLGFLMRKAVHGGAARPVDTKVFGLNLRLHGYDNKCEKRVICLPQMFDPDEREILKNAVTKRSNQPFTFIDLGANVGLYSLYLSSLHHPDMKIVAIEADPYIYQRLTYNIAQNDTPITAYNIAVADHDGDMTLHINRKNRGENSIIHEQGDDGETVTIPCKSLLSIMQENNITRADALKLDLEGAEEIVLKAFFEQAKPEQYPRMILIENEPSRWEEDVYAMIEAHGYKLGFRNKSNLIYEVGE